MNMETQRRYHSAFQRLNLKDDFEFDINDISRASTPTSTMSSKSEGHRRRSERSHHHRSHSIEDYKRKIARLKSELESEKARTKQMHREKSSEIKMLREAYEKDKKKEIESIEVKLTEAKKREIELLQETIMKNKDKELQQVLRYKEGEVLRLRKKFEQEKEKIKEAVLESEKRQFEENARTMEEQMHRLKEEKDKYEQDYKRKCEEEKKKEAEFSQIKEGYDVELRKILGEHRKLAMGNLEKLKLAEKQLNEGVISEDEAMSITESLRITPFSEISSRAPSRPLITRMDEFKLEELEIEKYLASATPSPNPAAMLGRTFTIDGKSPLSVIQAPDSVCNTPSIAGSEPSTTTKENRRSVEEKDRHLQKRISDLQTQTQRLERKIGILKAENDSLKRQKDDQRPLEEKIKTLKKRNAELAAIARRLEEKAKHLQQENIKKSKDEVSQPESDQMKKMFARQRNVQMYEEKEELVSIIKQAAKERLQMEKQLAKLKPNPALQIDAKKLKDLETTNETLQKELSKLEKAKEDTERLEVELTQKKIECESLSEEVSKQKERNQQLESELQDTAARNTQLTIQVSDLQHRLHDFDKVNEECKVLRVNLTEAQNECDLAKGERNVLQSKVDHLEATVKGLKESAEKLQQLEDEHQNTIQQLRQKQNEIQHLQQVQDTAKREYEEALHSLQSRVTELQLNCQTQEDRHKQLTQELHTLQAAASKNNFKQSPSPSQHQSSNKSSSSSNHPSSVLSSSSSSKSQHPVQEHLHQSNASLQEAQGLTNGNEHNHQVESTKSHDTGFADDDETELDNSHIPSPDHGKSHGDFEDPELNEISKKLKELEASDSEEELLTGEDKGEDSGMESQKEQKMKSKALEDKLSVPGRKGPIQVYIAKYSYDPFQHSPNDNPDAELPLDAGDYVLVYGEMDEDGFFDGELIDGRKGLVPSNFIERVADEDLSEFHAAMAGTNHHDDDSVTGNSVGNDLDFDSSEEVDEKPISNTKQEIKRTDDSAYLPKVDSSKTQDIQTAAGCHGNRSGELSGSGIPDLDILNATSGIKIPDSTVRDVAQSGSGIPCPREITLDRQLTNSIVISWKPPEQTGKIIAVKSYHVVVDSEVKMVIRGNERTKALIENLDTTQNHRVSVRCVSSQGQSVDRQCTLLIGKDAVPAPSELKASDITANSAHISWLPGNSNYQHSIIVNDQDICTCKPGVTSHTLTGLVPSSVHKVKVVGKSLTADRHGDRLSAFVEFKTLAGGSPDPPINVQVEAGPREGTLLLTWLPVTIEMSGLSNGAIVSGYVVYADGQKTKFASGPTNDHIILGSEDFRGFIPRQLMLRTVTTDNTESADSEIVKLPQALINEITEGAAKVITKERSNKGTHKSAIPQIKVKGQDGNVTDGSYKGITDGVVTEGPERDLSPMIDNIEYEEDFVETSSSSELSDIPEEVEEENDDQLTNRISPSGKLSPSLVNGHISPSKGKSGKSTPRSSPNKKLSPIDPQSKGSPAVSRVVPAIEITRDSSSERGNSFDVSDDDMDGGRRVSLSNKRGHGERRDSPSSKRSQDLKHEKEKQTGTTKEGNVENLNGHGEDVSIVKSSGSFSKKPDKSSVVSDLVHKNEVNIRTGPNTESPKRTPKHGSVISEKDVHCEIDSTSTHRNSPKVPQSASPKHGAKIDGRVSNSPHRGVNKIHNDPNANKISNSPYTVRDNAHISDSYLSHDAESTRIPQLDLTDYEVDDSCDVDSISGEINPPIEDNRVRLFVALFDYDPESMSPNVESLEEELPFKEGQIIKIYGDKDADGFYRGECNGRVGFVPCNMVSEVQVDDPDLAEQLLKESQAAFNLNTHISEGDNYMKPLDVNTEDMRSSPNRVTTVTASTQRRKMVALYDYDPQELSPNVDAELELSFKSGDNIVIYGDMDDDGFYLGELNGQRGLVPSNFLQDAPLSDEENIESASIISPSRSGESINNLTGSRTSDLGVDKTKKVGPGPEMEPQSQQDGLSNSSQSQTPTRSRSVSPEDGKQKKKGSSILSKGKSIFKKLTR
ncbi:hypothetical protein FSP39_004557 [Pinctada imbricata]|uniref:RIMS-binding protein 2 n=1 Tax=Pinctada imbricata TaxID=66713 RepID=A0AA88XMH8_PINIB|nr:hypothetical protein FSP39_004557 [Pinctada imbricata]